MQQTGAVLLLIWWAAVGVKKGSLKFRANYCFLPMLLFAGLIALQLLFDITAYRYATTTEALRYLTYGMVFFLALQGFATAAQARRVAIVLSIFGFALAVFAIIHGLSGSEKLYWLRAMRQPAPLYGPYVNHNHYAGLMEMLFAFPLVLSLTGRYSRGKSLLLGFCAVIMATSVFLSQSRGGMIALSVQLGLVGLWLLKARVRTRGKLTFGVVCVVLLALAFFLGSGFLLDRIATIGDVVEDQRVRISIARDTLNMIAERPVFGWGLGTFPNVYPRFRSWYDGKFVNRAHNDYLELAADCGLAGILLMFLFLGITCLISVHRISNSISISASGLRVAAMIGICGILVHSVSDFNMHIPANAVMFYFLCAFATAEFDSDNRATV